MTSGSKNADTGTRDSGTIERIARPFTDRITADGRSIDGAPGWPAARSTERPAGRWLPGDTA